MDFANRVDAVIDAAIGRKIVGTTVLVAVDGELAYSRVAGFADREAGRPAALDTIYRLASFTKPIVSSVALAMMDRGLLRLDQPVTDFLPWFTPALPDGTVPVITIRHLLTHTAGIDTGSAAVVALGVQGIGDNTDLTLEENLRRLAQAPLLYPPGTGWVYSKSIDVVGGVIAAIERTTLGAAVDKYVTGPLGMKDTTFLVTETDRLSAAYADGVGEPIRMGERHFVPDANGGAGNTFAPARSLNPGAFHGGNFAMAGTGPDFLALLETLRKGGAPILRPETVAMATRNQIGDVDRGPGYKFGLLSAVVTDSTAAGVPQAAGSYDWGGVYGCSWFVDPTNRFSVVMMTNTAVEGCTGAYPLDIRNAIYGV
ncbi:MAG TPA: serine hydrolase domain-containing protein [Devosiaceae bacterium]|jgi:CubicO group peptidase (beta-lactamase class C family)